MLKLVNSHQKSSNLKKGKSKNKSRCNHIQENKISEMSSTCVIQGMTPTFFGYRIKINAENLCKKIVSLDKSDNW